MNKCKSLLFPLLLITLFISCSKDTIIGDYHVDFFIIEEHFDMESNGMILIDELTYDSTRFVQVFADANTNDELNIKGLFKSLLTFYETDKNDVNYCFDVKLDINVNKTIDSAKGCFYYSEETLIINYIHRELDTINNVLVQYTIDGSGRMAE